MKLSKKPSRVKENTLMVWELGDFLCLRILPYCFDNKRFGFEAVSIAH